MGDANGRQFRILIIDDDAFVRRSMSRIFGRRFAVVTSESAADALALLVCDADFGAIICDNNLGTGLSGVEFHAQLLVLHPELARRTLIASGRGPETAGELALSARWIPKPFDAQLTFELIETVCPECKNRVA